MKATNPRGELRAEFETFAADVKVRKPRRKPLKGWTYCHASIFADIYCGERADAEPEVLDLLRRAFRELGALVGLPAPEPAGTPRAWKAARAAFLEMQRAARSLCQAEGLEDLPHEESLHVLDRFTRAGIVARVAGGLGALLHSFWWADEYKHPVGYTPPTSYVDRYAERIVRLRRWLAWAALVERYGGEAVRRAVVEREAKACAVLDAAIAAVPTLEDLLKRAGRTRT